MLWSNAIFPPMFLFRCYDYDINRLHGQILKFERARFGISEKWLLRQEFHHRYDMNNEDIHRPDPDKDAKELVTDQIKSGEA